MWIILNWLIFGLEVLMLGIGCLRCIRKKTFVLPFWFIGCIAVVLYIVYSLPLFHTAPSERNLILGLWDNLGNTIKQFVGEAHINNMMTAYAVEFYPIYNILFCIGAAMALYATGSTAIGTFGKRWNNWRKTNKILRGKTCDIIVGCDNAALQYAKMNPNTILLCSDNRDKEYENLLMKDGYVFLKRIFSVDFLKSGIWNDKTNYHFIIMEHTDKMTEALNVIISYLESDSPKENMQFHLETDEQIIEVVHNQIEAKSKQSKKGETASELYHNAISLFSKNELLTRDFVARYPITKYIPSGFITGDTSIQNDAKLHVFFLGYSKLSKELYRQFVINNQLVTNRDGEYRVKPIQYHIYDAAVDREQWEIDGLKNALTDLREHNDLYFELPDMPYETVCIPEQPYHIGTLKSIAQIVNEENSFCYFFIDTGDSYRNIDIGEQLELLIHQKESYRVFSYHEHFESYTGEQIIFYGNEDQILTHDVIVNENMIQLAMRINMEYLKMYGNAHLPPAQLEELNRKEWKKSIYFNRYSNISLANNLRLKLNLLGLDYLDDGKSENISLIKKHYGVYDKNMQYEEYFFDSVRNAMLAQEHYRWNAYHLLSRYLPMKKERILVSCVAPEGPQGEKPKIKRVAKDNSNKKHACLTTYCGLDDLSTFLAQKANAACGEELFSARDFEYYGNDELLLKIAPEFLKEQKHSVILKNR